MHRKKKLNGGTLERKGRWWVLKWRGEYNKEENNNRKERGRGKGWGVWGTFSTAQGKGGT